MKKILMINTTIIFILITIFSYDTYALKNNGINFQSITIDDGLSQSLVETIYQDSRGYIWLGTGDGLNRYNGSEFVVYRNNKDDENSISNNSRCINVSTNPVTFDTQNNSDIDWVDSIFIDYTIDSEQELFDFLKSEFGY